MQSMMRGELRFPRLWLLGGAGLVLAITWLSLAPSDQLPDVHLSDKVKHILGYVAMALWFGSIFRRQRLGSIAVALLVYGAIIELLQGGMGLGRQAEWLDLVADAVGVAAGLLLAVSPAGRWVDWMELLQRRVAR